MGEWIRDAIQAVWQPGIETQPPHCPVSNSVALHLLLKLPNMEFLHLREKHNAICLRTIISAQ